MLYFSMETTVTVAEKGKKSSHKTKATLYFSYSKIPKEQGHYVAQNEMTLKIRGLTTCH